MVKSNSFNLYFGDFDSDGKFDGFDPENLLL